MPPSQKGRRHNLYKSYLGLCICQKKQAGDLDGDGKISISDVTKLLNVIAGRDTL